jgi:hypothetical protein
MATFRLRHFSSPLTLKAVAPHRLLAFLDPFREFFRSRGLNLPLPGESASLDYESLVKVFMSPDTQTPSQLIDALYFVDEMSSPEGMDALLEAVKQAGRALDHGLDQSPTDVAVQVWLLDPNFLERKHAEQYLYRPRSFEHFQTEQVPIAAYRAPTEQALQDLEGRLDNRLPRRTAVAVVACSTTRSPMALGSWCGTGSRSNVRKVPRVKSPPVSRIDP